MEQPSSSYRGLHNEERGRRRLQASPAENALADKIGHDWKNREEYDKDDGSVMDW
jgi:hypothetical protein